MQIAPHPSPLRGSNTYFPGRTQKAAIVLHVETFSSIGRERHVLTIHTVTTESSDKEKYLDAVALSRQVMSCNAYFGSMLDALAGDCFFSSKSFNCLKPKQLTENGANDSLMAEAINTTRVTVTRLQRAIFV